VEGRNAKYLQLNDDNAGRGRKTSNGRGSYDPKQAMETLSSARPQKAGPTWESKFPKEKKALRGRSQSAPAETVCAKLGGGGACAKGKTGSASGSMTKESSGKNEVFSANWEKKRSKEKGGVYRFGAEGRPRPPSRPGVEMVDAKGVKANYPCSLGKDSPWLWGG